jgi:dTMP kinase
MFIVIDGIDGAGKSTQIKMLAEYFKQKGWDCITTKEPYKKNIKTDNPFAELLLFFADRIEHQKKVIKPALAQGKIVLCDRFLSSTLAYQVVGKKACDFFTFKEIIFASDLIFPDLHFNLVLPPSIAINRIHKRGQQIDEFEKMDLEKVLYGFEIYKALFDNNVKKIDANRHEDEIFDELKYHIEHAYHFKN